MKYSVISACLLALLWTRTDGKPKDDSLNKDEEQAKQYLEQTNKQLAEEIRKTSEAQWAYNTNITDETSAAQVRIVSVVS